MRRINIGIFFGAMMSCLIGGPALVQAQPVGGVGLNDASSEPPAGAPTSEDDSTEDDSTVVDEADSPWSAGVSAEDRRTARALLREGSRLYLVPLYAKAAEQYEAALRKWKHPAIYYNLALTQRNLGKEIDARENLEHALKYGEKGLGTKRFGEAQKQLADVSRLLGWLQVTCQTFDAEVTLDGATLFGGPGRYQGW